MFDPVEQTLIRAWIKGLSPDSFVELLPEGTSATQFLAELKQRLCLKARRLNPPWQPFFNEPRQATDVWEQTALKHFLWLSTERDLIPSLDHLLSYWLDDPWLPGLDEVGLTTLRSWFSWRATQGNDWWRNISGIGQQGAKKLDARLAALFPTALSECQAAKLLPETIATHEVVPLNQLRCPTEYDGSQGKFRGTRDCFIPAENDYQAIQCWLARFDASGHSYRAYHREIERLLLWSLVAKHKALSSLDSLDITEYRRFLQNPQPTEHWIGPNRPRSSADWRPFTGPLSVSSVRHAETILSNCFQFLLNQGYTRHNPYLSLPKLKASQRSTRINIHRSLSPSQWTFINEQIDQHLRNEATPDFARWVRLKLLLNVFYATGLRLHELAQATLGDISKIERHPHTQVWLQVLGKGQKQREVPLSPSIYQLIIDSNTKLTGLTWQQLSSYCPLIPPLRHPMDRPLTPKAIYVELKMFFQEAAQALEATDVDSANKLRQATTHWLRHTHGTVAVDRNIPLTIIRDNLGHASISTTSLYLHADADERYDAFGKFM